MRKIILLLPICIYFNSCNSNNNYLNPALQVDKRVELLLKQMTLDEKIGQMCQYVGEAEKNNKSAALNEDEKVNYALATQEKAALIKQGKIGSFLKVPSYKEANYLQRQATQSRLKIPLLIATDAIHGHGLYEGYVTIYPTEIGIAASFDTSVARLIAQYTAIEMRATGNHWAFSPNIEISRDPRWGRFGETFGEDPYLVSAMGVAMIKGYQGNDFSNPNNVLACAKHFVAGGIPNNGMNGGPADISDRTLNEIFFPPFINAINAGVFTIMPAHNEINGMPCHAHKEYLTSLIRNKWNFNGFFISDWMDIERLNKTHKIAETPEKASQLAVLAGMDMHMHGPNFFDHIKTAVENGTIPMARIDDAVRKILKAKIQLGLFENRFVDSSKIDALLLCPTHRQYALESARRTITLLKNKQQILPLSKNIKSIFIGGPNANNQSLLGDWARIQPDSNITTVLEGIELQASSDTKINFAACNEDPYKISTQEITAATKLASKSEVAILVVGENSLRFSDNKTCGENLDRADIDLAGKQKQLVEAIVATGVPVILVLINGAPIASAKLFDTVAGIIEAWEPGMYGGHAIAEVLFGDYNPSGRLPVTIPRSTGQIQAFYNYKPSAFHRGRYKEESIKPLFDFGFGLSYTNFDYSNLKVKEKNSSNENVNISFDIKNTGIQSGNETVLIFIRDCYSSYTSPIKKLVGFKRVSLNPQQSQNIQFTIQNNDLAIFDANLKPIIEKGEFEIMIGIDKLKTTIIVE